MAGVHGGIILNDNFMLGLGGHGITTNVSFQSTDQSEKLYLYGGYGGLIIGGIIAPKEVMHIAFPVLIGAGGIDITNENYLSSSSSTIENRSEENSAFLVIEPGIDVEINLTKFFKVALGAKYRFVSESDLINASDNDLSGFSGGVSFVFGSF